MPISSNVFGPLPGAEEPGVAGVDGLDGGNGAAGLLACVGAGFGSLGCCCCCMVATLLGLGMASCMDGRPAEPGREDGYELCPGVVVDGLSGRDDVLLS
jgi:hypothetical protein